MISYSADADSLIFQLGCLVLIVQGGDLDQRITECRESDSMFTEAQINEWIIEILLALQYMHNR